MTFKSIAVAALLLTTFATSTWAHDHRVKIRVAVLEEAPVLDGDISDWHPYRDVHEVALRLTSVEYTNTTTSSKTKDWSPQAVLISGIHGDRLYIALTWNDDRADEVYRPWKKFGARFSRARNRDDMAALRFHVSGKFNDCMISGDTYSADVWRWSAGRSALAGIADDMTHHFSTTYVDSAAEYPFGDLTVYIRKVMDEGDGGWRNAKRPGPAQKETVLRSIEVSGEPHGSRADVLAHAKWNDGRWTLELSRLLETDDSGDAVFLRGGSNVGQIALFNAGYRLRKMVSGELLFQIPAPGERSGAAISRQPSTRPQPHTGDQIATQQKKVD